MTLFCCWRFLQKYMWNLYLSLETQKNIFLNMDFYSEFRVRIWFQCSHFEFLGVWWKSGRTSVFLQWFRQLRMNFILVKVCCGDLWNTQFLKHWTESHDICKIYDHLKPGGYSTPSAPQLWNYHKFDHPYPHYIDLSAFESEEKNQNFWRITKIVSQVANQ